MKVRHYLSILLLLNFSKIYGQKEKIIKFEFQIGGRGWNESVDISNDSILINQTGLLITKRSVKSLTSLKEWASLLCSISKYKLDDLVNLPSPTNKREFDGAAFSTIKITTNKKEYNCGGFDNYNPNEKLNKLMEIILAIEKSKL